MTTKINLSNLTDSDYKALLQNDTVVDKLIQFTTENASLMIDDWLTQLDGVRNYSLSDSSQYNYMEVSNSYHFLKSVLDAQKDYGILADEQAAEAEKVLNGYENSELEFEDEEKLDEVGEKIAEALVCYAQAEYDNAMSDSNLLDAMKEYEALTTLYGDDAYYNREDNKIYYVCAD